MLENTWLINLTAKDLCSNHCKEVEEKVDEEDFAEDWQCQAPARLNDDSEIAQLHQQLYLSQVSQLKYSIDSDESPVDWFRWVCSEIVNDHSPVCKLEDEFKV